MQSRGVYRGLHSVLLDDPDYQQLPTAARCLLMTLRLCRDAGPAVIFEYATDRLMRQTGLGPRALERAFQALEAGQWIVREPPIVWVRNGLRYDPSMSLANPKHRQAVLRSIALLPDRPIVATFCKYYRLAYPSDSPPNTYPIQGVGSREKGVGTTDLHAVEISEHVESDNLRRVGGVSDSPTPGQPPTSPDVARAPSDPDRPKHRRPRKGQFADLVATLWRDHPDWSREKIESLATQHYYDP